MTAPTSTAVDGPSSPLDAPPDEGCDCYCGRGIGRAGAGADVNLDLDGGRAAAEERTALLLCRTCAVRRLAERIDRRRDAFDRRDRAVEEYSRRRVRPGSSSSLSSTTRESPGPSSPPSPPPLPDPNLVLRRVSAMRSDLAALRRRTDGLAVAVASTAAGNDGREERIEREAARIDAARERLEAARRCLLLPSSSSSSEEKKGEDPPAPSERIIVGGEKTGTETASSPRPPMLATGGGLADALSSGAERVRFLRFRLALRAFDAHRMEVVEAGEGVEWDPSNAVRGGSTNARQGVGKIGGLPLPHAGPTLYGVLPPAVLASSLRSVASLTCIVARCLGVVLPHPILLRGSGADADVDGDVIHAGSSLTTKVIAERVGEEPSSRKLGNEKGEGGARQEGDVVGDCEADIDGAGGVDARRSDPHHSGAAVRVIARARPSLLKAIVGPSTSLLGRSARRAIALASGGIGGGGTPVQSLTNLPNHRTVEGGAAPVDDAGRRQHSPPSRRLRLPDAAFVSDRVRRASVAVLIESRGAGAAEYALDPPRWNGSGADRKISRGKFPSSCPASGDAAAAGKGFPGDIRPSSGDIRDGSADRASLSAASTATSKKESGSAAPDREAFRDAEERFATGLQLLQNDVVALCFRAGVDASELHPAEAVLLNLRALRRHCQLTAENGA